MSVDALEQADPGVANPADRLVAATLGRLGGEQRPAVLQAVELVVAAAREGSSCHLIEDTSLVTTMSTSPLVTLSDTLEPTGKPLRLNGNLLYLDRYWRQEQLVSRQVVERSAAHSVVDLDRARAVIGSLFPDQGGLDRQRLAVAAAVLSSFTVIAGGPGTGKTTTLARVIAALHQTTSGTAPLRIGLAAPTGKAASRLQSAVASELARHSPDLQTPRAVTLHRLLGLRPGGLPRHHAGNPLPHDVLIVDETSMVSLTMLSRLLAAARPDARLILVGDPDQLASVDIGAVLADLVDRRVDPNQPPDPRLPGLLGLDQPLDATAPDLAADLRRGVVTLRHGWRFGGQIQALAHAIQRGSVPDALAVLNPDAADAAVIGPGEAVPETGTPNRVTPGTNTGSTGSVSLVAAYPEPASLRERVVGQASRTYQAAQRGDASEALASLATHQLLTAHRHGPYGAALWSRAARRWATEAIAGYGTPDELHPDWYPGRAVLVVRNDEDTGLSNGDTGVAVLTADGLRVAFDLGNQLRLFHPARLPESVPWEAITVHRAQGSQFSHVTVVLPPADSPLLTRQLLYTAVTRAEQQVTILGDQDAVRVAIENPARRASGLR